jgi:hypothetical protein
LASDYFNCGVAYEKAQQFDAAIRNFNLYLIAGPDAQDANAVRKRIGGLSFAREKAKKEQQQIEAQKNILQQLRSRYDGATYLAKQCSYAKQSICFEEAGVFPCGCTEQETYGRNWYENNDFAHTISIQEDGTIRIFVKNTMRLRGTLKGQSIENIMWEGLSADNTWKPVWVKLDGGFDRIFYSPHGFVNINTMQRGNRPVDDSQFSPHIRYDYVLLIKR